MKRVSWNALAWVAAMGAAWAGRRVATLVWSQFSDTDRPVNPADRSVTWAEAAGWAVMAGMLAALGRVLARRGAAAAWEKVTGDAPPGVQTA